MFNLIMVVTRTEKVSQSNVAFKMNQRKVLICQTIGFYCLCKLCPLVVTSPLDGPVHVLTGERYDLNLEQFEREKRINDAREPTLKKKLVGGAPKSA